MARRGDTSREAEQGSGNIGMAGHNIGTGRVLGVNATSMVNLGAASVVTPPATQTRPRSTVNNQNVSVIEESDSDEAEDSSGSEFDFMDFVTVDEVSEGESANVSLSDSVSDRETEEVNASANQVETSQEIRRKNGKATIKAALEIMGIGEATILGQELTQSSVDEAIGRLLEATSMVTAQRRTPSGNYNLGRKQKGD